MRMPARGTVTRSATRRGSTRRSGSRWIPKRPGKPGAVIMVGALIIFITAIIGWTINATGFLDAVYMDLTLTLPKFGYEIKDGQETGNETFKAFQQMRMIGAGILGGAIVYAGIVRVLENESIGIVQRGISNQIISNSLIFIVFLLAFPPLWDLGAEVMEDLATWILNPLYSFDPERPCPDAWYEEDGRIVEEYNKSDYKTTGNLTSLDEIPYTGEQFPGMDATQTVQQGQIVTAEFVCEPGFKVRYVFNQMMGTTELEHIDDSYRHGGFDMNQLLIDLQTFASDQFVNIFLGLTKALVTINILISAFVIGIMADVLIGMIIAAMPVFLFLTLIPKAKKIADQFIEALPALFLLPVLSATVIVVGAGFLAGIVDDGSDNAENTLLYKWIASIGIVFLAVSLPVMLVGMLGKVSGMATQAVTSGVQTAAMVTGMAAAGGAQGLMQGRAAGGGFGSLSKLGILAGAGMAGMGHGIGSSMSGIAKGSGFDGTSMSGGMGSMGDSMSKEFGDKGAGGSLGGITSFLQGHLGPAAPTTTSSIGAPVGSGGMPGGDGGSPFSSELSSMDGHQQDATVGDSQPTFGRDGQPTEESTPATRTSDGKKADSKKDNDDDEF